MSDCAAAPGGRRPLGDQGVVYDPLLMDLAPAPRLVKLEPGELSPGRLVPRQELSDIERWTAEALADGDAMVELPGSVMARLLEHIEVLEGNLVWLDGDFCHVCGCTQSNPCLDDDLNPCGWETTEPPLCDHCAASAGGAR